MHQISTINKKAEADFLLCVLHQTGYLVPRNLSRAIRLCKQAASRGSYDAQKTLAILIERAHCENPYFHEALDWFITAENCLIPEGLYTAAVLLNRFGGNAELVFNLHLRASKLGYLPSINRLALLTVDAGRFAEVVAHLSFAAAASNGTDEASNWLNELRAAERN